MTAGQRTPASHSTNILILTIRQSAPAGVSQFCGTVMPKPAPGQGTTPPTPHIPALSHPVQSQFIPFVQGPGECAGAPGLFSRFMGTKSRQSRQALFSPYSKAWALSGFGAAAWLPGSECAIPPLTISLRSIVRGPRFSPSAHAVLLNSLLPFQLPPLPGAGSTNFAPVLPNRKCASLTNPVRPFFAPRRGGIVLCRAPLPCADVPASFKRSPFRFFVPRRCGFSF